MEKPSRVATIARIAGLLGVVLLALGPLLVQLRLVSGFLGFRIFGLGLLAGLLALLLGALGVWLTRVRSEGFGVAAASCTCSFCCTFVCGTTGRLWAAAMAATCSHSSMPSSLVASACT